MPSKNIAVQKGVYDVLEREKRPGESFTSTIRRLLEQRRGLDDLCGSWGAKPSRSDRSRLRQMRAWGGRP